MRGGAAEGVPRVHVGAAPERLAEAGEVHEPGEPGPCAYECGSSGSASGYTLDRLGSTRTSFAHVYTALPAQVQQVRQNIM